MVGLGGLQGDGFLLGGESAGVLELLDQLLALGLQLVVGSLELLVLLLEVLVVVSVFVVDDC